MIRRGNTYRPGPRTRLAEETRALIEAQRWFTRLLLKHDTPKDKLAAASDEWRRHERRVIRLEQMRERR